MFRRRRTKADAAPVYADLRGMALGVDPAAAGFGPTEALPRVYGVVMDTVYPNGAATLVALVDGTTSLYLSSGGGTIGAGRHENVAAATLTYAGRHAVTAAEDDFGNGRHELSPLFHGAHAVITELRLLHAARGD